MPSLTRNATPGPSTLVPLGPTVNSNGSAGTAQTNAVNRKDKNNSFKRPSSETPDEMQRDKKRSKIDHVGSSGTNGLDHESTSAREKDKKKRRRRRRKRFSIVPPDVTQNFERQRSAPVSSSQIDTATYDKSNPVAAVLSCKEDSANEALAYSSSDKGKGKARSDSPASSKHGTFRVSDVVASGSRNSDVNDTLNSIPSVIKNLNLNEQSSEIVRLKEQLAQQGKLLERHQSHLSHQQQALTCQICLDLMHKPYALSPCGHTTCYDCLIRWFTVIQNFNEPPQARENGQVDLEGGAANDDNITRILDSTSARRGTFLRRWKTCPMCRTVVYERPAEMWGIKNMVSALVRSHLVDLPEPPTVRGAGERNQNTENGIDDTDHDPWRNVFRAKRRGQQRNGLHLFDAVGHAPPHEQEEDRERFGWYDAEDGGIYRCVDCYHEIWDGVCSGCERVYQGLGDDHEEEEEHNWVFQMPPRLLWGQNGDEDGDVYSDENQEDLGLDFGPGGWLVGTTEEEDYDEDDDEDEETGMGHGALNLYLDALEDMNEYSGLWGEGRRNLVSDPSDLEDNDEKSGDEEGIITSEADEGLRRYEENYITSDSEAVESVRDGMARSTRSQTRTSLRRLVESHSDSLSEGDGDGYGYFTRSRVEARSDSLSEGDDDGHGYFTRSRVEARSVLSGGHVREDRYQYDGPGHFTRSCRRDLYVSDSDSEDY